mgnify:CR=1 FL=1
MRLLVLSLLVIAASGFSQNDNSISFDGTDDYIDITNVRNSLTVADEYTIEFWFVFDFAENDDYETFFTVNQSDGKNRLGIRASRVAYDGIDGSIAVVMLVNGGGQYLAGDNFLGDGQCHHVAFTYSPGACKLYIDGVLNDSANHTFDISDTDVICLGQDWDFGLLTSAHLRGEIDDFRIWDVEKTQAQIVDGMHVEMTGSETNLITNFTFNQGIAGGNNSSISALENSANLSENGVFIDMSLNGVQSNFIEYGCDSSNVFNPPNDSTLSTCGDVFIPSAFTPNEDLSNDVLCVYGKCIRTMNLKIFNRWGEKIVETEDKEFCWEGAYKGVRLESAVFHYVLEATLTTGASIVKKGNISLIR